jgi:hypothetical protein
MKLAFTCKINAPVPGTTGMTHARRPLNTRFPSFGSISLLETSANSSYNSLQISLVQSNWHGLSGSFACTDGHSIDTSSEARSTLPANSYDVRNERGNSIFDVRHTFRGSFIHTFRDIPGHSGSAVEIAKASRPGLAAQFDSCFQHWNSDQYRRRLQPESEW